MLRATLLALLFAPLGCTTTALPGAESNRLGTHDGGNGGGAADLGHSDGGGCDNGGVDLGPSDGGWPIDGGPVYDGGWPIDGGPIYPIDAGPGWPLDAGSPEDLGHHHPPHDAGPSPTDLAY